MHCTEALEKQALNAGINKNRKEEFTMKKHIKNLALLGFIVTGLIVGFNKLVNVISNMNDHLPVGKGKYFNWKYGDIYYTKTGHGKPLLLIHNLDVCSSAYEWTKVVRKLSRTNTVYALDLLGCGRSDKPNLTYSNYLYVQLLNDFIKKVIGSKTDVVATGDSFSFVIMASQMEEDNFNKIIGVSPCDIYEMSKMPGRRKNFLKFLLDSPIFGTFIYNIETNRKRITEKAVNDYFHKPYLVSKEMINAYYKGAKNYDGHGKYLLASIKSHYTNINITRAVENTNQSICLIGGKEHPYMNEIISEYRELNAAIEEAYVAGTNYLPQLESPEKFVELIQILIG